MIGSMLGSTTNDCFFARFVGALLLDSFAFTWSSGTLSSSVGRFFEPEDEEDVVVAGDADSTILSAIANLASFSICRFFSSAVSTGVDEMLSTTDLGDNSYRKQILKTNRTPH